MTLANELQALFDSHLTDLGPSISEPDENGDIFITWESNNDGHPTVVFKLCDIGDADVKSFDLDISIGNNDNVGPKEMLAQTLSCMKQFYDLGLNTRFGHVIGD
jgi:hypothetical protein